mgnify:CR=1 FL=1
MKLKLHSESIQTQSLIVSARGRLLTKFPRKTVSNFIRMKLKGLRIFEFLSHAKRHLRYLKVGGRD